jgi:hypothetical protein
MLPQSEPDKTLPSGNSTKPVSMTKRISEVDLETSLEMVLERVLECDSKQSFFF